MVKVVKGFMIGTFIFLAFVMVVFIICTATTFNQKDAMFKVPSLNIELYVKHANTAKEAQEYIDLSGYGAYYGKIVADHNYQKFATLPNIEVGATAEFKDKNYVCTAVTKGYSINGLQPLEGQTLPKADLYAITCTGEVEYEVWVVCFNKK